MTHPCADQKTTGTGLGSGGRLELVPGLLGDSSVGFPNCHGGCTGLHAG